MAKIHQFEAMRRLKANGIIFALTQNVLYAAPLDRPHEMAITDNMVDAASLDLVIGFKVGYPSKFRLKPMKIAR